MAKTESVDVKTGEVVDEALVPIDSLPSMLKERDVPLYEVLKNTNSLDWKSLTPPQLAVLIMQKPLPAPGGGQLMLNFNQAVIFATRCFELNLSPFSSEVWFDTSRGTVNITLEGRKRIARNEGVDLGPPNYEDIERDWPLDSPKVKELKALGFEKDVGIKCRVRVGPRGPDAEYVEYSAFISEWFMTRSPVWKERMTHMLQIRSYDKCISLALGTGVSDMISDT